MSINTILIIVEGGVIQDVIIPNHLTNLQVEVRDYDIDGTEEENLRKDFSGQQYVESVWSN